ncbi:hypothetical protein GNI_092880 [Gregarina niphandrodes]|uniref:Uncharacterized protein n=1 Tax=Gregarina niphandrodes TaxID=110365 RepID=A0A023B5B1_GRENI|nr:hypothetical protein GNI_092880 [Gregarina niphandrodes]EZG59144.1 hypothetical protein GNI_092880 [Gregarina niphandrodes]|eukprot:XP_011130904.1 hypothetical protein GNI_092880 [Gregarina niphandrodes]
MKALRLNQLHEVAKSRMDGCNISGVFPVGFCCYIWRPVKLQGPKLHHLTRLIKPPGHTINIRRAAVAIIEALKSKFSGTGKYPLKLSLQDVSEVLAAEMPGETDNHPVTGLPMMEDQPMMEDRSMMEDPSMMEDRSVNPSKKPALVQGLGDHLLGPLQAVGLPVVGLPVVGPPVVGPPAVDSPATPVVQEDSAVTYDWDGSEYFGHVYVLSSEAMGFIKGLEASQEHEWQEKALKEREPELAAYAVGLALLGMCVHVPEAVEVSLLNRAVCNYLASIQNTIRFAELPPGVLELNCQRDTPPATTEKYLDHLIDVINQGELVGYRRDREHYLDDYHTILYAGIRTNREWRPHLS